MVVRLGLGAYSALQLYANLDVTGTIPSTISSMTALTLLDLSSNALNGTIPTVIGSLTNLMYVLSMRHWRAPELSCESLRRRVD